MNTQVNPIRSSSESSAPPRLHALKRCALAFALFALPTPLIAAPTLQTIYVDASNPSCPGTGSALDPFCAIQDAIAAAVNGDLIEVAPGTYLENIDLLGKSLMIQGRDGAAATIIDGSSNNKPVVSAFVGETLTLDGLTIQNGQLTYHGAGIHAYQANLTISNCVITGNQSQTFAGGLYASETTLTITKSTISGNSGNGLGSGGGGVYAELGSTTITECLFINNSAAAGVGGGFCSVNDSATVTDTVFQGNSAPSGGGFGSGGSSVVIARCEFTGNSATSAGGGGVSAASSQSFEISRCLFRNNTAAQDGGGFEANYGSSLTMSSCLLDHNTASNGRGGGASFFSQVAAISGSTFSGNSASTGGGGAYFYVPSSSSITNSIFWGDTPLVPELGVFGGALTVSYSDIDGGFAGTGNINSDPLFLDTAYDDYRLACSSPCIDAGTTTAVALDFEGEDRTIDGDSDGTAVPDMGADEFDTLWVVNQPAAVQYNFTAMAPPAQHGNAAFLFLSFGDGSATGGLPVPVSGGQRLFLDADVLFNAWINYVSSPLGKVTLACPANSTAPIPSQPGKTVYYAGFSVDLGTGKIPSVTPTHSYVTQ